MDRCAVDCRPKEEIDKVLGSSNIAVYSLTHGIDLKNSAVPFKRSLTGNFISADSRFTKLLDIFMKVVKVKSDFGYVGNNFVEQDYVIQDIVSESISSEYDQVIFKIQVQMSSNTEVYDRNYKKIFSFISELGGYLKAMVILAFLYHPFLKRLYYLDVINTLYRIEQNRPLNYVQIDQSQERRLTKHMKADEMVFIEKDTEFKDALEKQFSEHPENKKEPGELKELKDPLSNTFDMKYDGNDIDDYEPGHKKNDDFNYGWLDWTSVICPCMKTKKHKLLDRVDSINLG